MADTKLIEERLFGWFQRHQDALPKELYIKEGRWAIKKPPGYFETFPILGIGESTRFALTTALLLWLAERARQTWSVMVRGPVEVDGEWLVEIGLDNEVAESPDLITALLNAAEAMEAMEANE
jgi:hypothetical protein